MGNTQSTGINYEMQTSKITTEQRGPDIAEKVRGVVVETSNKSKHKVSHKSIHNYMKTYLEKEGTDPDNLLTLTDDITIVNISGQDGSATYKKDGINITAVADGHGKNGEFWSTYSLVLIPPEIAKRLPDIIAIVEAEESEEKIQLRIDMVMSEVFQNVDTYLREKCEYTMDFKHGGSTLSVVLAFPHPSISGALCSVTSNVGDSPVINVNESGDVQVRTLEHNAESLEAYTKFCKQAMEMGIVPSPTVIGRINKGRANRKRYDFVDETGALKMIEVFSYDLETRTVKVHNDNLMQFYNNAPIEWKEMIYRGGSQSISGQEENRKEIAQGRFPYKNFGNTAGGKCQCLSSFGDEYVNSKKVMPVHTSYRVIVEPSVTVMGSDGFFDVLTHKQISECILKCLESTKQEEESLSDAIVDALWEKMSEVATKNGWEIYDSCPTWDDVTLTVIVTSPENVTKDKCVTATVDEEYQEAIAAKKFYKWKVEGKVVYKEDPIRERSTPFRRLKFDE